MENERAKRNGNEKVSVTTISKFAFILTSKTWMFPFLHIYVDGKCPLAESIEMQHTFNTEAKMRNVSSILAEMSGWFNLGP